jgi:hypothetical protein
MMQRTEPGDSRATVVTKQWIVGKRPATTFLEERTENFGGPRPQWA